MPGVADWQQREVTWEQGPIRALVSTVRSTPVIPVRGHHSLNKVDVWHRSNPRANPYLFKPPLFRQAVRGHHAPDRFLKKKLWTGGIRKRAVTSTLLSRPAARHNLPPWGIDKDGRYRPPVGGGGGVASNSPWR